MIAKRAFVALLLVASGASACTSAAHRLTEEGTELARRGDVQAAEARFQAALEEDAGEAAAIYWLGQMAERRGDYYAARDWYRRAATRAQDRKIRVAEKEVSISVLALADLERVGRVIATLEGHADRAPESAVSEPSR